MNFHTLFFLIGAFAACGAAIGVVLARNVIRMAMLLVGSLGSVALLFFLAGADFVGAMQLMVYVGGTLVLLAFGVMLTAAGDRHGMKTRCMAGTLAAMVGCSLIVLLLIASGLLSPTRWNAAMCDAEIGCGGCDRQTYTLDDADHATKVRMSIAENGTKSLAPTSGAIGSALVGVRTDTPEPCHEHENGEICRHEHRPALGYMLPFEIVSVHLVVVLIAAAYLARAKKVSVEKRTTDA
ncbi:MAG: NADH-quinone oxidoreductase subunit J [Planctomycetia bacterium]|nr:NADH-quinone oxidoreductase subunit J [Planctomycetia bacterium]